MKLNISEQRLVETFGPPATPIGSDGHGRRCGFYNLAGYSPARVQLRVCFVHNKLGEIATVNPGTSR